MREPRIRDSKAFDLLRLESARLHSRVQESMPLMTVVEVVVELEEERIDLNS